MTKFDENMNIKAFCLPEIRLRCKSLKKQTVETGAFK